MKYLIIILLLISTNSFAQEIPKYNNYHNYKGTKFYGHCIDGIEYLQIGTTTAQTIFPRLKKDGKPVLCNY